MGWAGHDNQRVLARPSPLGTVQGTGRAGPPFQTRRYGLARPVPCMPLYAVPAWHKWHDSR